MMNSIIEHERKRLIFKYSIRFLVVLMISTAAFLISNRSKFRFIAEFEKKHFAVHEGNVSGIHYKVGELNESCNEDNLENNFDYNKKGYYIDNNKYYITLGQKSSGGYDLFVTKIKKSEKAITIIVKEVGPGEIAPQWITCPNIKITFYKNPGEIEIRDTNGNIFNKLN